MGQTFYHSVHPKTWTFVLKLENHRRATQGPVGQRETSPIAINTCLSAYVFIACVFKKFLHFQNRMCVWFIDILD